MKECSGLSQLAIHSLLPLQLPSAVFMSGLIIRRIAKSDTLFHLLSGSAARCSAMNLAEATVCL